MDLTRMQKTLLTMICFGVLFHLSQYYSPQWLVDWAWHGDSDIIALMFNNFPVYDLHINNILLPSYIPLLIHGMGVILVLVVTEDNYQRFKACVNNNRGLTLVEVMIVIAIIGILSAIAVPMFDISKMKLKGDVSMFRGACQLARMQSLKTNSSLYIGFKNDRFEFNTNGVISNTFPLNPRVTVSSPDIVGGAPFLPKVVPQSVVDGGASAIAAWTDSYKYDYVTIYNSRSFVSSGAGTYVFTNGTYKISVVINSAGNVKVGQLETIQLT